MGRARSTGSQSRREVLGAIRSAASGSPFDLVSLGTRVEEIPRNLLPLVAHAASNEASASGAEIAPLLVEARRAATVAWMVRRNVLGTAVESLRNAQVPFVLLKGAALALQVYPHPSLRTMSDLDLWVPDPGWAAGVDTLMSAGFAVPDGYGEHGIIGTTACLESRFGAAPVLVEIHSVPGSIENLPEYDRSELWENRVHLPSGEIPVLHPADHLLHLCLHLSRKHRFSVGLSALVDISLLVRRFGDTIDWPRWTARVRRVGAIGSAWTPLRLASDLMDAPVPEAMLRELEPPDPLPLLAVCESQLWAMERQFPSALDRAIGGRSKGWFMDRFIRKHWSAATRDGSRSTLGGAIETLVRLCVDVVNRLCHYARLLVEGRLIRRRLWTRVRAARGRGRIGRLIQAIDEDPRSRD